MTESGFFWALLQVMLIGFKLSHIIDWSWFFVFLPTTIGLILGLICLVVVFAIIGWVKLTSSPP